MIGPGLGALTLPLAQRARKLVAVEADRDMAQILAVLPKDDANATVVNEPFEHWKPTGLGARPLVIGNLPYNLTTKLIECAVKTKAQAMGFMVQREVADRLSAQPGSRDCGALSCYLALLGEVKIAVYVPKGAFYPVPKVDSAFVSLAITRQVPFAAYRGLKKLFVTPNKRLGNVLRNLVGDVQKQKALMAEFAPLLELRAHQVPAADLQRLALAVEKATGSGKSVA